MTRNKYIDLMPDVVEIASMHFFTCECPLPMLFIFNKFIKQSFTIGDLCVFLLSYLPLSEIFTSENPCLGGIIDNLAFLGFANMSSCPI